MPILSTLLDLFRPDHSDFGEDELRRISESDDAYTAGMAARCNRVDLGVFAAGRARNHASPNTTEG